MFFYDVNDKNIQISFKQAVLKGFNVKTGGVFMPSEFTKIKTSIIYRNPPLSFREIAFETIKSFACDEISDSDLMSIIAQFYPHKIPITPISPTTYILELFHGNTCNYKDIGSNFFAFLIEHFNKNENTPLNVILPASGERACSTGYAFSGIKSANVIILYPKDSLTEIQKKQISNTANNVHYVCVDGNFADCEQLATQAISDTKLKDELKLVPGSSAVNIAPLLIQTAFYIYAALNVLYRCAYDNKIENPAIMASVPSGSFSGITSGLIAKKMGVPISGFICVENANHVMFDWFKTGTYPKETRKKTNSPALDIAQSVNFKRMLEIYSFDELNKQIIPVWFEDADTIAAVKNCNERTGYIIDPYGAMAWQAWQNIFGILSERRLNESVLKDSRTDIKLNDDYLNDNLIGLIMQTSHPAKFPDIMSQTVGRPPSPPPCLENFSNFYNNPISIKPCYTEFKEWLLSEF